MNIMNINIACIIISPFAGETIVMLLKYFVYNLILCRYLVVLYMLDLQTLGRGKYGRNFFAELMKELSCTEGGMF